MLVSPGTAARGLWQSAAVAAETERSHEAVAMAANRLASLPSRSFMVMHHASRQRHLQRILTVTSDAVQRISVSVPPPQPSTGPAAAVPATGAIGRAVARACSSFLATPFAPPSREFEPRTMAAAAGVGATPGTTREMEEAETAATTTMTGVIAMPPSEDNEDETRAAVATATAGAPTTTVVARAVAQRGADVAREAAATGAKEDTPASDTSDTPTGTR